MIRFGKYLTEARLSPLYHATGTIAALAILHEKNIDARTGHSSWKLLKGKRSDPSSHRDTDGVSLTRSFDFAKKWAGTVIFEFDQQKLAQKFKIIPINFWQSKSTSPARGEETESEEFVVTKKGIPLSYVTAIYVNDASWHNYSDERKMLFKASGIPIKLYNSTQVIKKIRK